MRIEGLIEGTLGRVLSDEEVVARVRAGAVALFESSSAVDKPSALPGAPKTEGDEGPTDQRSLSARAWDPPFAALLEVRPTLGSVNAPGRTRLGPLFLRRQRVPAIDRIAHQLTTLVCRKVGGTLDRGHLAREILVLDHET
jgi:hypothetical protein